MKRGCKVTLLGVDGDGNLDLEELERAISPQTAIVSVMWANNETGVLFPIEQSRRSRREIVSCFTLMPSRRPEKSRFVWRIPRSISFRFPRTNYTAQKAWARFMSEAFGV